MKPIVLWLDDKKDEIRDQADALARSGYKVVTARDLMSFRNEVEEMSAAGQMSHLRLVVIDIMLEGVADIASYFSDVRNGNTAHGYAAGLVFLERVIICNQIFSDLLSVPIVINSKRAMNDNEKRRISSLVDSTGVRVQIFEKAHTRAIFDFLAAGGEGVAAGGD